MDSEDESSANQDDEECTAEQVEAICAQLCQMVCDGDDQLLVLNPFYSEQNNGMCFA